MGPPKKKKHRVFLSKNFPNLKLENAERERVAWGINKKKLKLDRLFYNIIGGYFNI